MILTDAGPLVAILDQDEEHHEACVQCLAELAGPMLTTWAAFAEAMYLLGNAGGWRAQNGLWHLVEKMDLDIAEQARDDKTRMRALMEKYQDLPMDLADAWLVALAEERGADRIFTLNRDFHVYRLPRRRGFTVIP